MIIITKLITVSESSKQIKVKGELPGLRQLLANETSKPLFVLKIFELIFGRVAKWLD